jgi:hypothetical protein
MKNWIERPSEVAYLLNPAFCGRLLYGTIRAYNDESNRGFPFPLAYLVLPLLLHKATRNTISSRTQFLVWQQRSEHLLVHFAKRAEQLVQITNEAVEFLLQSEYISVSEAGELSAATTKRTPSKTKFADDEVKDCAAKSEHIGKWFARTGKTETIYITLGVRP